MEIKKSVDNAHTYSMNLIPTHTLSFLYKMSLHNRYNAWYNSTIYTNEYINIISSFPWSDLKMKEPLGLEFIEPVNAFDIHVYNKQLTSSQINMIIVWVAANNYRYQVFMDTGKPWSSNNNNFILEVNKYNDWMDTTFDKEDMLLIEWDDHPDPNVPIPIVNPMMIKYFQRKVNAGKRLFISDQYEWDVIRGSCSGNKVKILKSGKLQTFCNKYLGYPVSIEYEKDKSTHVVCSTSLQHTSVGKQCMYIFAFV